MRPSRRTFMKWVTTTGIAVGVSRFAVAEVPDFRARETLPGPGSAPLPGRIDGIAKVTGAKLYASDFRAADLPGWPRHTAHALLVRAPDATHVYQGLDLALLSGDAKPSAVVTADDLARARIRSPAFYAGDLLCPVGKTPLYLGQPVALLMFAEFEPSTGRAWRSAMVPFFALAPRPVRCRWAITGLGASRALLVRPRIPPTSIPRSMRVG